MAIRQVDTYAEQLTLWLEGESVHVTVTRMGKEGYECCPDFSCCYPKLLASLTERQQFAALTQKQRNPMLMTFLDRLVKRECPGEKVRIIG